MMADCNKCTEDIDPPINAKGHTHMQIEDSPGSSFQSLKPSAFDMFLGKLEVSGDKFFKALKFMILLTALDLLKDIPMMLMGLQFPRTTSKTEWMNRTYSNPNSFCFIQAMDIGAIVRPCQEIICE